MSDSTTLLVAPTSPRMGRPRINAVKGEMTTARFRAGTLVRIKASLRDKEAMSDLIREAVEAELTRREQGQKS